MFYKLLVSKLLKGGKVENINIFKGEGPLQVLRQLATCYREANPKTRKNSAIVLARSWEAYTPEGATVQKFFIKIKYDENNIYIYEYEFQGCGLE